MMDNKTFAGTFIWLHYEQNFSIMINLFNKYDLNTEKLISTIHGSTCITG